jgi:hypothetical protein
MSYLADRLSLLGTRKLVISAKSLKEQETWALMIRPAKFPTRDQVKPAHLGLSEIKEEP